MDVIEKYNKVRMATPFRHFPHSHVLALALLTGSLAIFAMLPSDEASATRSTVAIEIPSLDADNAAEVLQTETSDEAIYETQALETTKVTVKSGDNLSRLFKRAGLNDRHMMELLSSHEETERLASLRPGHMLEFSINEEKQLFRLDYVMDRLNSYSFVRNGPGFDFNEIYREPDIRVAQSAAFITQSLYTAGVDARLDNKLIMELAEIFGWDIDFALDIRKGDHFKVVYEERFLDGEKLGNGSIIAAEFTNQGEKFQAVRYVNAKGEAGYFTPDGKSMRKEFLRAPVDFRRISSRFNPRRLHPIFKTVKPHRGIDYAAPRGTPVWSSGNGRVTASGYSKANGNYVVIQHGNSVQTKYLHLHKRFVKTGQRVKQKQKIGTVGSTGYATGAHLHYEFLMNGVHRNPRTILNKLPKAKSISPQELSRFILQTRDMVAQLNESTSDTQYATAEQESPVKSL